MADKNMPRKAVIAKIAEEHGTAKTEAERILRTALSAIAEELAERGRFHIAEIGSVSVAKRRPRRYFDPRTRLESTSAGDLVLKINISKSMHERMTGDTE